MMYLYYFGAVLLILVSWRSFRGGIEYLRYFKQELTKPRLDFAPFTTVIAPCKGVDEGLATNLEKLLHQVYPAYEVVFVVDDADDPAVAVIKEILRTAEMPTKLVIAGRATDSGQKVENLREAVLHADSASEVFVFVDSDVRPGQNFLRDLVAPLADSSIGGTTGYRWFVSEKTNFAAELRSVWNASIASALGPDKRANFCWGGAMAIRRDVFERLAIREKWRGTLSDDLAVTRVLKAAGMQIYFVPQAIAASTGSCCFGEMLEFTTRQMKIVRVYAGKLWLASFLGAVVFNLVMAASVVMLFVFSAGSFAWRAAVFTLVFVSLLGTVKAWLRAKAVRLVMPGHAADLDRKFIFQITLWLITPTIFLYNSISALFSKRIRWRGTEYEMVSPTETRVL